jgi:hypothetical protein
MSIGIGIFFLAVGAILAFALQPDTLSFVNVAIVGYVLMAAGSLQLMLGLALILKKRKSSVTNTSDVGADGVTIAKRETSN